ncbi:hypothetical protein BG53_01685 [Paenibacillus darwinianus]|uniref:DUF4227 domain-containing protein n=1 Tax=Paenibacillus darwinianus TaxID=1380763 RepID=A0A9W5W746_9BACL|nr:DUF4227 family protein [Paenibacillus darwinianus]EXX88279.1 hypothetical protein BG52_02405 [Paenibacillus darwinianus]EXX88616.1 hypothetical protein BG53_01685 [Paenibacillus darwinianus]EXX91751.1 hypothetical protein CH50_12890 [Paenibacillus darwinianus]
MVISLHKAVRRLAFAALLLLLTVIVFFLLRIAADWIRMPDPYAVPQGNAVKAFGLQERGERGTFAQRLREFYAYGE